MNPFELMFPRPVASTFKKDRLTSLWRRFVCSTIFHVFLFHAMAHMHFSTIHVTWQLTNKWISKPKTKNKNSKRLGSTAHRTARARDERKRDGQNEASDFGEPPKWRVKNWRKFQEFEAATSQKLKIKKKHQFGCRANWRREWGREEWCESNVFQRIKWQIEKWQHVKLLAIYFFVI